MSGEDPFKRNPMPWKMAGETINDEDASMEDAPPMTPPAQRSRQMEAIDLTGDEDEEASAPSAPDPRLSPKRAQQARLKRAQIRAEESRIERIALADKVETDDEILRLSPRRITNRRMLQLYGSNDAYTLAKMINEQAIPNKDAEVTPALIRRRVHSGLLAEAQYLTDRGIPHDPQYKSWHFQLITELDAARHRAGIGGLYHFTRKLLQADTPTRREFTPWELGRAAQLSAPRLPPQSPGPSEQPSQTSSVPEPASLTESPKQPSKKRPAPEPLLPRQVSRMRLSLSSDVSPLPSATSNARLVSPLAVPGGSPSSGTPVSAFGRMGLTTPQSSQGTGPSARGFPRNGRPAFEGATSSASGARPVRRGQAPTSNASAELDPADVDLGAARYRGLAPTMPSYGPITSSGRGAPLPSVAPNVGPNVRGDENGRLAPLEPPQTSMSSGAPPNPWDDQSRLGFYRTNARGNPVPITRGDSHGQLPIRTRLAPQQDPPRAAHPMAGMPGFPAQTAGAGVRRSSRPTGASAAPPSRSGPLPRPGQGTGRSQPPGASAAPEPSTSGFSARPNQNAMTLSRPSGANATPPPIMSLAQILDERARIDRELMARDQLTIDRELMARDQLTGADVAPPSRSAFSPRLNQEAMTLSQQFARDQRAAPVPSGLSASQAAHAAATAARKPPPGLSAEDTARWWRAMADNNARIERTRVPGTEEHGVLETYNGVITRANAGRFQNERRPLQTGSGLYYDFQWRASDGIWYAWDEAPW